MAFLALEGEEGGTAAVSTTSQVSETSPLAGPTFWAAPVRRAEVTAGSGSAPPLGSASWCLGQEAQILASHLHNRTMCLNSSKIRLFLEVLEGR